MGEAKHARPLFSIAESDERMAALRDFCEAWARYHVEKSLAAMRLGNAEKAAEHVHYADAWKAVPLALAEEVGQ